MAENQYLEVEDTSEEVLKQIEKDAELKDVVPDELRRDVEEEFKKDTTSDADKSEDVYKKDSREEQLEDDEISAEEEEFLAGEEEDTELGDCSNCGKVLSEGKDSMVAKEINKNRLWFCSKNCLHEFEA